MSKKHVLLVDDSKSARFALRMLLQKQGFSVDMAESAESALEMLKANRPDAIFMDHMMPGMDGFEATEKIKHDPATAHIPVVMCTSNDDDGYVHQAKNLGALGILPKPPTPDKLTEILSALEQEMEVAPTFATVTKETAAAPAADMKDKQIEKLILKLLPSVIEDIVGPLMDKKVIGHVEKSTQRIVEQSVAGARDTAQQLINAAINNLRDEILAAARIEAQTLIAETSRRMVAEELNLRLEAQTDQLRQETEQRIEQLKSDLPRDPVLAAKIMEQANTSAVAKAGKIAEDRAEAIATGIAEEVAITHAVEATAEILPNLQALPRRVNLLAFAAAAVGVGSAVLVYFLR